MTKNLEKTVKIWNNMQKTVKNIEKPSKLSKNLEKSVKMWNNLEKTVKNVEKR